MGVNATLGRMAGKGTPAVAAAERAGITFAVHEYEHDPRATSFGLEAVDKLGLDPARVFKTLVADVEGTLTVAVVPVEAQLDLRVLGKRARMAEPRAAERATGYVTGGISPLQFENRMRMKNAMKSGTYGLAAAPAMLIPKSPMNS